MGKNLLRSAVILVRLLVFSLISSAACDVAVLTVPSGSEATTPLLHSSYEDDLEEDDNVIPLKLGEEEIERLKERILQGLGLTRIPDMTKMNVSQEEYETMYGVYLNSVEENRLRRLRDDQAQNERLNHITAQRFYSFTHTEPSRNMIRQKKNKRLRRRATTWLYFPVQIPEISQNQHVYVEHATLRLLVSGLSPEDALRENNVAKVKVFKVLDSSTNNRERRLLVDERDIHLAVSAPKWTEFDVTHAAESWISGTSKNLGLEFECLDCVKRGVSIVTQETHGSNSSVNPVLNILANIHVGNVRDKRSTADDMFTSQTNRRSNCRKDQRCCRHTMEVVFSDLKGFGFIVQPKKFDAGYCKGRCPPRFNPAHHHALIQSLIWKQDRQKAPKLCCAPYTLSDLEILHKDENDPSKLKVTRWKGVSVVDCACS